MHWTHMSSGLLAHANGRLRKRIALSVASVPEWCRPLIAGVTCSVAAYFGFSQSSTDGFATMQSMLGGRAPGAQQRLQWIVAFIVSSSR